ncbi:ABC transporter substrate-binding protein [Marinobacter lacisalsi]|uniref:ABC transporter substrate-binding protein n=1 Tax=Marinobacter lacisalsi TaxID=475979 RepID=A0ABV8QIB8_9GAMM
MPMKACKKGVLLVALCSALWGQARAEGTLTVGLESDPIGFNAAKARLFNQTTSNVALAVMEGLFAYDREGNIVPRLGLELTEADDRLSATVTLREGVTFHDGTPFNADAVVAHYDWITSPGSGINTAMIEPIDYVEKVDEYTVRFVLNQPWVALKSALAIDHMFNFIGSPTAVKADPEAFHRHPVGTGPFVFEEWRSGERLVVSRNANYWDSNLPHLDQVVFRVLPDNDTRNQSLRAGEVDVTPVPTPVQVVAAREDDSIAVHEYESSGALSWNFHHRKEPFKDPEVRRAVIQAVDQDALIKVFYQGTTVPTTGLFSASSEWHCEDLDWPSYNPEQVRKVLEEKGSIQFEHISTNTPAGRRLGAIFQHFFQEAGFDTTLKLLDQGQNIRAGLFGNYQVNIWRYVDFGGDPDLNLTSYLTSTVTRHDVDTYKPLLEKARTETDRARRKQIYCDIAQQFADDAVFMMPVQSTYYVLASPKVKDVAPLRNNLVQLRDIRIE